MSSSKAVTILSRFQGPPKSGNGGYTCGLLGKELEGVVEVTLRLPPPLDQPLTIRKEQGQAVLLDGNREVATARAGTINTHAQADLSWDQALVGRESYVGLTEHLFDHCFVCGTQRQTGDGLRLFTGPVPDTKYVACSWSPEPDFVGDDDYLKPEFVWSALDCPAYWGIGTPGLPAVLGRMTAELNQPVRPNADYVVSAWGLGQEGKKYFAASAIHTREGEYVAMAETVWIEIDPAMFT